ncbi:hypothetical protein [Nocardia suismassiliense]|uniref:hypothetical protein n=1 Tax=Nocardia suismassiliense TaxID=2077092 RepID=UPI000D1EBCF8|nr:hypothetical protein [Nocardia suismassiliense]
MKSFRLLIILLASITALVIAAFVWTLTGDNDAPDTGGDPAGPTMPTHRSFPDLTPSATSLPPMTDLFGSRLEVPTEESGVALQQEPTARPDPARPDYLTAPPAWMQWQRGWGGAALPVSGSDGPARIQRGVATDFARTPQGAALAALDALGRALAAPEGTWQRVVAERYYGGGPALVSRFARSRERTADAARYVVVPDGVRVRPGYRDDLAVVEIASRAEGGYAIATWPMAWISGDWRVRVPDDIETLWGPAASVPTLTGFGSWKNQP